MHAVYLILAVAGGTLLVLQVILQAIGLFGGDTDVGHGDGDAGGHDAPSDAGHHDGGGHEGGHGNWFLGVLSLKALSAFAGVFGLSGLALEDTSLSPTLQAIIAVEAGIVAMVVVAFLMRGLSRLSASGTIDLRNAVQRTATVYLRVPASRTGPGKVTVEVQGRLIQAEAVTDGPDLPTGEAVRVVEVLDGDTVRVERAGT